MARIDHLATVPALLLVMPCAAQVDEKHHRLAGMPRGLYRADNQHTDIYFAYDHVGFSHARARFDRFAGTLSYNPQRPEQSPAEFTVDPASVNTNVPELDRILKGHHFFNVGRYADIRFMSRSLRRTSATTGVLAGDLTLHGVTRAVTLDVRLNKFLVDSELKFCRFGFSASGVLKRSQWGLGDIPLVGDDIRLELEVEFVKVV